MGASSGWNRSAVALLGLLAGAAMAPLPGSAAEPQEKAKTNSKPDLEKKASADVKGRTASSILRLLVQPGDDPPQPSVPLRPATVDDRQRLEATRLYTAARALEDRGQWSDAVAMLQDAARLDPDSVAIARRLARIYVGALGRPEQAVEYSRRVLSVDPDDTETLARLIDYFLKRGMPEAAESELHQVLANPKLIAHSPGRIVAEYELGRLYSVRLKNLEKAADAYAEVIEELDSKAANRLSQADIHRILGSDPSNAYLKFGLVFLAAHRDDLVIKALERGLVYDEDNPEIALKLAEALLREKKADRALELVERIIRRQPQGVEPYDLLARVLKAMGREAEITPRLEEAARRDDKNVPLQYVLADRYRETGQVDKADALYRSLLKSQPTPQTYRALAASLLKRRKANDLLKVFCDAWTQDLTRSAILPQAGSVAQDNELTLAMLDAGIEQLSRPSPGLPPVAFRVLNEIATADKAAAVRPERIERLLKLHRIELAQSPPSLIYRQIADTQSRLGKYAEAAATVKELFEKYPTDKNVGTLVFLADFQRRAGQLDAARASLAEALKLGANNEPDAMRILALRFADVGNVDQANLILAEQAKREPNNWVYDLTRAEILGRFDRNQEAIQLYEEILKRFGNDDEAVKFARAGLSGVYVNMGDYPKGEAQLERLLQRNPDEAGPNNDLGYLYAEQGKNLEKAEAMIQKALQEDPENSAYLDSLGWVLYKRGKLKEALEAMKKAVERMTVERSEPDVVMFEHLGDIYFQLQDAPHAEESWKKALEVAGKSIPPARRASEIRKKLDDLRKLGPRPRASAHPSP